VNYLETLNHEQKKAVLATEGPVLIVAGAGAGKTKTITYRILHLIHTGIPAENILAITFTNKAAKEMRERVHSLLASNEGEGFRGLPFVSTFHALGVRIIKENAERLGLPRHFTIFDKTESKKIIKDALQYFGLEPKEHLDKVSHSISREKGRGNNHKTYLESGAYDYSSEITGKIWTRYEEILHREHALDFDDLLLKTLELLNINEVRDRYQKRFTYIHVDEYQDTNAVQNKIVDILAGKHGNLCVVGDTDQNIYSWRGAEIKNMLHFEKSYPKVQTIFLEQNYRSTKTILSVANTIIEKNTYRIPKALFTENESGEKISLFEGRNETDEAHFIALTSQKLIESGVVPDNIAVLYRANFQSRALEEAFLAYNVPYQLLGTKFFERKEIKDVMSYVKASINLDNTSDFARIINIPARGIGKVTLQKIIDGKEHELPESGRIKIQQVRDKLATFGKMLQSEKPSDSIKYIITHSGIEDMYAKGNEEDVERLENVYELVTLAKQYDHLTAEEGIEALLTDTALHSDQDDMDEKRVGVKLLTVHASKGLEFEYVFIAGLETDLFPHARKGQTKKTGEESEEERRLFYVALTRARQKLYLTRAGTRTIFGTTEVHAPSEFLDDIPEEHTTQESYGGVQTSRKPLFSIDF